MNETLKTIATRYSCRAFTDEIPTDEQINAIATAAVQAPSAMNGQPWRIIVVKNKELIHEMDKEALQFLSESEDKSAYNRIMSRGGSVFYNAPCMIFIPMLSNTELDCGIVSENIALAATSLGLGNVICGLARLVFMSKKGDEFKKKLNFPEGYEFGMSVLIGYAKNPVEAHVPDMSKISFVE